LGLRIAGRSGSEAFRSCKGLRRGQAGLAHPLLRPKHAGLTTVAQAACERTRSGPPKGEEVLGADHKMKPHSMNGRDVKYETDAPSDQRVRPGGPQGRTVPPRPVLCGSVSCEGLPARRAKNCNAGPPASPRLRLAESSRKRRNTRDTYTNRLTNTGFVTRSLARSLCDATCLAKAVRPRLPCGS